MSSKFFSVVPKFEHLKSVSAGMEASWGESGFMAAESKNLFEPGALSRHPHVNLVFDGETSLYNKS
jgi:hypothetical protein